MPALTVSHRRLFDHYPVERDLDLRIGDDIAGGQLRRWWRDFKIGHLDWGDARDGQLSAFFCDVYIEGKRLLDAIDFNGSRSGTGRNSIINRLNLKRGNRKLDQLVLLLIHRRVHYFVHAFFTAF